MPHIFNGTYVKDYAFDSTEAGKRYFNDDLYWPISNLRPVTLSYDGDGATNGSVESQTLFVYRDSSGNIVNPSIVLAENGFVKEGYDFVSWDIGEVGTTVVLSEDMVAKAVWEVSAVEVYSASYDANLTAETSIDIKNTTYLDPTANYFATVFIAGGDGMPGTNRTLNGTLVAFTEAAKKYKYAKITMVYLKTAPYADVEVGYRTSEETDITNFTTSGDNNIYTEEITIKTANVSGLFYRIYVNQKSSAASWGARGSIGVQSIVLTN